MFTTHRLLRILSIVAIVAMMLSSLQLSTASAQAGDDIEFSFNAQTGKLNFISPKDGRALPASQVLGSSPSARPADPAMALAERFGPEFGLQNPGQELSAFKTMPGENGRITVRYQQSYEGVPVMGGELIVNTTENGDFYSINGEVSADLSVTTQPTLDPGQARQAALESVAKWYQGVPEDFLTSEPELWIFDESILRASTRPAELVWRMDVTALDKRIPVRELVLINAQRGGVSLHFNQIDTAWGGSSSHPARGDTAPKTGSTLGMPYQLPALQVRTYTANNTKALPGTLLCNLSSPNCTNGANPHADKAHQYAIGTYNMYLNRHARYGIDGNNMPIISTVHYDVAYENAFWNSTQMVYGDGAGFPMADDVVAHELTHGVTEHESSLYYYYQSGAINESFSDLWGEYYDQSNGLGNDSAGVKWLTGEDVTGWGALRSMSDPTIFSDPDRMSSVFYVETGDDSGGVHSNSGVNNKAAYLMVDGGSFNGKTVTALGWNKTLAIYYEAQTRLLSSGADYSDLYSALQTACLNLIGQQGITSANCTDVKDALDAVEMSGQPATNFNPDAPLCNGGNAAYMLLVDDLESGASRWTFNNGAHVRWQYDSPLGKYAQSGNHFLYADDFPAQVTDAIARWAAFTVPNNAVMHFAHAFDFDTDQGTHYDGGVLEYSTNGGATWQDASPLMINNSYNGTIAGGFGNPLAGRQAFTGASHGYISTRLNLGSLAGQSVTFRWRMGLDSSVYFWGWWLDNIKIYTCGAPNLNVFLGGINRGSYFIPANRSAGISYAGANSGPVKAVGTGPITVAEQVTHKVNNVGVSFTEIMGLPDSQLDTTYWLPWYNNVELDTQLRIANVSGSTATIQVFIGGAQMPGSPFTLAAGASTRKSFAGVNNGPVRIVSNVNIIAAERVVYKVNGVNTSFSEMMALPNSQLDTTYWLPWYNNIELDTQLRFANVSGSNATVQIFIGGAQMPGSPFTLAPGASTRKSFAGVSAGPVKIVSNTNIIVAERVVYKVNGVNTSFTELMALPNSQLDTTYWLPWYNNVSLDTQLRFANVSGSTATVQIFIGGTQMPGSPFTLAPGASTRKSFAGAVSGPVRIVSNVNIIAAERVVYKVNGTPTSFSEMMAVPNSAIDTIYWMPWYNNAIPDLDTQLRFGVP